MTNKNVSPTMLQKQKDKNVNASVKDWLKNNKPGKVETVNEYMFQIRTNDVALTGLTAISLDFGDIDFDVPLTITGLHLAVMSEINVSNEIRQIADANILMFMNGVNINPRPAGVQTMPGSSVPAAINFVFKAGAQRIDSAVRVQGGNPQLAWSGSARFPVIGIADEVAWGNLSVYFRL